jgi:UDP-glucose 4-epimerase
MRVLITGGAGFIGANLVRRLLEAGYSVVVYDDLSRGRQEYLPPGIDVVRGDIRDQKLVASATSGCDTVIHLAASGSVVDSVSDPGENFSSNVAGTFSVLNAARAGGVRRFIFASTGGALIGEAEPPVDEQALPKPISPYGASKLCGEAYCHAFAQAYGMHTLALRFANVYGPYSAHKKGAVTSFIKRLFLDEALPIFGDGSATRDYLHVSDLCAGIESAINADLPGGDVVHLSSGTETDIVTVARLLAKLAGKSESPLEFLPARVGEVSRNFARYDKAARVLNFAPTVTLEDGLADTFAWYQAHREEVLSLQESES